MLIRSSWLLIVSIFSSVYGQSSLPLCSQASTISEYENLVKNGFLLTHEDSVLIAFGQLKKQFLNLPTIILPYGKCGTELAFEANQIRINKSLKSEIIQSTVALTDSLKSPSGRFTVHYSTSGSDSTSKEYADSIASYADQAFDLEIGTLGYRLPPSSFAGDTTWHINIADFGTSGNYGFTQPMDQIGTSMSGLPLYRCTNTIDNNFSEATYPTHGLDAARITVFHEFHHSIQIGGYGWGKDDINFREMTSVWMEMRSTPEVKDYLQYIKRFFQHIDQRFDKIEDFGYSEGIWMQYLEKKFGEDIIKNVWEFYSRTTPDFPLAFDSILTQNGSSFCTEYGRFGTAIFFSGVRFSGNSIFPDASLFPSGSLKLTQLVPNISTSLDAFFPISLAISVCGYGQDTAALVISRNTNRNISRADVTSKDIRTFNVSYDAPETFCDTVSIYIPVKIKVFPNPFLVSGATNEVSILASTTSTSPVDVDMNIYASDNSLVRHIDKTKASQQELAADAFGGSWYIKWDGLDDAGRPAPSGVYSYSIRTDGLRDNGKFIIIRKN